MTQPNPASPGSPAAPAPVVLERRVRAPIAQVWRAWVDPDRLNAWFSPNPGIDTVADIDLRVGGAWSVRMGRYCVRGSYVDIAEPTRLVFTWRFDHELDRPSTLVSVDLTAVDNDTTGLRLIHRGHPDPADRDGTAEGWELTLARLTATA